MSNKNDKYSEKLIQRVNELFHDYTSEDYHHSHPEIFNQEVGRWRKVAQEFFQNQKPLQIIEIGSGTGFVPITIGSLLKKEDTFICTDISANMLGVAEKNISEYHYACNFRYVKIESSVPYHLNFPDHSADIILMNSVLHHIQDSEVFLGEINRVLKKGGSLIVAHEPNRHFFESKFLLFNYYLLNSITSPRYGLNQLLKILHLKKIAGKVRRSFMKIPPAEIAQSDMAGAINKILMDEKLINNNLSLGEMERMVDIKSEEGFKPDKLIPGYGVLFLDTYNHPFWLYVGSPVNKALKFYDRVLRKTFPSKGSTFFVVLRKNVD